jgi:hypothetical protein
MKKLLLIALLIAAPTFADEVVIGAGAAGGGGTPFDGGPITNPLGLPDGSAPAPALYWNSEPTMGWWHTPPVPGSVINQMHIQGAAGSFTPTGELFKIRQQDTAVGTRVYWLFKNPDDPASQGSTVEHSMRFQSSQQTATNAFEMNPFGATFGGWSMSSNTTDGNRLAASSTTTGTSNRIEFFRSAVAGDGVDVDMYISGYDNGGTEYLRLTWPHPTGTNVLDLPDETGSVHVDGTVLALPNGSAAAPAAYFTTDPDTGIFHEAVDEINFASRGLEIAEWRYNGTTSTFFFIDPSGPYLSSFYTFGPTQNEHNLALNGSSSLGIAFQTTSTYARIVAPDELRIEFADTANSRIRAETNFGGTAYTDLVFATPTGTNTITLPDATGVVTLWESNQILAPTLGSVSAPSYSWAADPDTGIFHEANNEINFTSNGNEILEARYSGSGTLWQMHNPLHAGNAVYGTWFNSSALSNRLEMYNAADTSNRFDLFAHNTYTYFRMSTPTGGYTRFSMMDDTTTAGQILWQASGDVITAPTNYLALQGPVGPSGANTLTVPEETGTLVSTSVQTQTTADSGDGSPATDNLDPLKERIQLTCNDADTCDYTIVETGAVDGRVVSITNVSANVCDFVDTAGVSELAGVFAMGQYDTLTLMYAVDRYVEVSRSDN